MKKTILTVMLYVGSLFCLNQTAYVQEIDVSREINEALRAISEPLSIYALDLAEAKNIDASFEKWVAENMDFEKATKRESRRFKNRETCYYQTEKNHSQFMETDKKSVIENKPTEMFYKHSPNCFSYRKYYNAEATTSLKKDEAIQIVKGFLLRNNFVKLNDFDTFGDIQVPELRRNCSADSVSQEREVVLLQRVKFQRMFRGVSVVNSMICVDFFPDTKEILGFKHYNWTPGTSEKDAKPLSKKSTKNSVEIQKNLNEKIKKYCNATEKAQVDNIMPAWFQTETELIPILACEIKVLKSGNYETYQEYINLTGNDDIFYTSRMQKISPTTAPK
jgi:hypothetical protein